MACRSQWRSASVLNEWDVINLKTAKALGLGLLLGLSNTVIELAAPMSAFDAVDGSSTGT